MTTTYSSTVQFDWEVKEVKALLRRAKESGRRKVLESPRFDNERWQCQLEVPEKDSADKEHLAFYVCAVPSLEDYACATAKTAWGRWQGEPDIVVELLDGDKCRLTPGFGISGRAFNAEHPAWGQRRAFLLSTFDQQVVQDRDRVVFRVAIKSPETSHASVTPKPAAFSSLLDNPSLCDLVIRVEPEPFGQPSYVLCQRDVLAKRCPHFESVLTLGFNESSSYTLADPHELLEANQWLDPLDGDGDDFHAFDSLLLEDGADDSGYGRGSCYGGYGGGYAGGYSRGGYGPGGYGGGGCGGGYNRGRYGASRSRSRSRRRSRSRSPPLYRSRSNYDRSRSRSPRRDQHQRSRRRSSSPIGRRSRSPLRGTANSAAGDREWDGSSSRERPLVDRDRTPVGEDFSDAPPYKSRSWISDSDELLRSPRPSPSPDYDPSDDYRQCCGNELYNKEDEDYSMPRYLSQITIKRCSYATVRAFIEYLYTGDISFTPSLSDYLVEKVQQNFQAFSHSHLEQSQQGWLSWQAQRSEPKPCNPHALYRLADRYLEEDLKERAKGFIVRSLTVENVAYEAFSALSVDFTDLQKPVLDFLLSHWDEVKNTTGMSNVRRLLASGYLPHGDEILGKVFDGLTKKT
ncbi:hypothetical protein JCM10213_004824 [Rhodosporidiobolus nylandii]